MTIKRKIVELPLSAPTFRQIVRQDGPERAIRALDEAFVRLQRLHAPVPAHSRLRRVRSVLADKSLYGPLRRAGSKARRLVAEAHRTALEWWMISRSLNWRVPIGKQLHRKLQRAYSGSLDPLDGSQVASQARDAQFELWLGAWLTMGDRPVSFGEPDLRTALWFKWRGIAAKRVTSVRKLHARTVEAANQLRKHLPSGFVAVAVDNYAARRSRRVVDTSSGERFFKAYPQLEQAENWLVEHAPWVLCVLSFGCSASWEPKTTPPLLNLAFLTRVMLLSADARETQHMLHYFSEHAEVMANRWS